MTERANLPGSPFDGAEIIYSYTREQALADGVLVDVSELAEAREAGFVWPVAISRALWEIVVPTDAEEAEGQSYEGRLWDVLYLARPKTSTQFNVVFAEVGRGRRRRMKTRTLRLETGPGDDAEPVVTIGFPIDF